MTTTYNQNEITIHTEEWAPFNRLTGEASNIDAIIAVTEDHGILYENGLLRVTGQLAAEGDNAYFNDDDAISGVITDDQLDASYLED